MRIYTSLSADMRIKGESIFSYTKKCRYPCQSGYLPGNPGNLTSGPFRNKVTSCGVRRFFAGTLADHGFSHFLFQ